MRGEGRHLRLFRVDRWDSGVYYCSTNASLAHDKSLVSGLFLKKENQQVLFVPCFVRATSP